MLKPRPEPPEVPRITTADEPLAEDQARRARRYLEQMGIRLVCFLLAVFTWGHIPGVLSGVLLVGAVVLPYVAVILVNAGRGRNEVSPQLMEPPAITDGRQDDESKDDGWRD